MKTYLQASLVIYSLSIFATPALGMERLSDANTNISALSSEKVISFNSTSRLNPVEPETNESQEEYRRYLLSKTNNLSLESNVSSRSDLNTSSQISGGYSTAVTLIRF
ncbi:MAG: hypothetical protein AAGE84_00230 [Cyanobacteria bacterium P01_G01_bin.39]